MGKGKWSHCISNTFILFLIVEEGGRARKARFTSIIPPVRQVTSHTFVVGIEIRRGGRAEACLVDCHKSRRTSYTRCRVIVPPWIGRARNTHSLSSIPEVGRNAADALIFCRNEGSLRRADAAKLCGFKNISIRTAGLICSSKVWKLLGIQCHKKQGNEEGYLHDQKIFQF